MKGRLKNKNRVRQWIEGGEKLPMATQNYPSRGQTAIQELYQTKIGKLFLKKVSQRNHQECQIHPKDGTLAEREYWAFCLASFLRLKVPELILMDSLTTVQIWFDLPDGRQYTTAQKPLELQGNNVFDCALFDWLTAQVDRHDANYLYDFVQQEIILIDSGHAFLKYSGSLPDYLRIFEAAYKNELHKKQTSSLLDRIKNCSKNDLEKQVPLRNLEEKEALFARQQQLKQIDTIAGIIHLYRIG